jgi:GGDEF domain-containing protein
VVTQEIAARLEDKLSRVSLQDVGEVVNLTVSLGYAGLQAGDQRIEDLLRWADMQMYRQKTER